MRLTFPNGEHPAVDVPEGELGIGSADANRVCVQGAGLAATHVRLTRDAKGLWLRVVAGGGGVHVNARPVNSLAMLRPGDLLCLGHLQARVCAEREADPAGAVPVPDATPAPAMAGVRVVLRAVSGAFSGRSFSLGERLVLGGGAGVDVRLEDPALADARLELGLQGARVVLKVTGGDAVEVNGLPVREAALAHGDQIVIEQQRFVLEAPGLAVKHSEAVLDDGDTVVQAEPARRADTASTVWWLIAAAATLAAILTALLLYGPGRG